MAQFGIHSEGFLHYPLKRLDSGYVIPDVSLSEVHKYNQESVRNQIEIGVKADELGYDFVVHPENHLKLIGKNSPTPIQVQIAVAERTEDIRLLQMANILPWHEPIKIAERIGMLDTISDGRTEVGVGIGSGDREREIFSQYRRESSIDREKDWELFREKYDILLQSWSTDFFDHHGESHDIPPEDIAWGNDHERQYLRDEVSGVDPSAILGTRDQEPNLKSVSTFPQPKQKPHPQIWKPVASERAAIWAAQHGINGCTFCTDFAWMGELLEDYYEALEDAGWPDHRDEYDGQPFNYGWDEERGRGLVAQVPVFNTEVASDEAFERYKLGQEFHLTFRKATLPSNQADDIEINAEKHIRESDAPIVGDSEHIIEQLAMYEAVCGYEDFAVFLTFGVPGMTHEDKIQQIRAFSEEVAPYFEDYCC